MTRLPSCFRASNRSLRFESLEHRHLLAVTLDLIGSQLTAPLLDGSNDPLNVNVSNDSGFFQAEMSLDINPTNPLNLAGFSFKRTNSSNDRLDFFYTTDGANPGFRSVALRFAGTGGILSI